jgi:hypothetical protein
MFSIIPHKSARIIGDLEREHRLEPLPPTEITENASLNLKQWGVNDDTIHSLRQLTSSFRYDCVEQKLDRLITNYRHHDIAIRIGNAYYSALILNGFYDEDEKCRMDGECSDLTRQWIRVMDASGLFDEISSKIEDGKNLLPLYCNGYSDKFFVEDHLNHVWSGLGIVDENMKVIKSVYVDPSMQKIFTDSDKLYRPEGIHVVRSICDVSRNPEAYVIWPQFRKLGKTAVNGDQIDKMIMGLTDDREYAVSISFGKYKSSENKEELVPLVCYLDKDGDSKCYMERALELIQDENQRRSAQRMIECMKKINITSELPERGRRWF